MSLQLVNAALSLEACRSILHQQGQYAASSTLKGLEVYDITAASLALSILQTTRVYGANASLAKAEAIAALERAVCARYGDTDS